SSSASTCTCSFPPTRRRRRASTSRPSSRRRARPRTLTPTRTTSSIDGTRARSGRSARSLASPAAERIEGPAADPADRVPPTRGGERATVRPSRRDTDGLRRGGRREGRKGLRGLALPDAQRRGDRESGKHGHDRYGERGDEERRRRREADDRVEGVGRLIGEPRGG